MPASVSQPSLFCDYSPISFAEPYTSYQAVSSRRRVADQPLIFTATSAEADSMTPRIEATMMMTLMRLYIARASAASPE